MALRSSLAPLLDRLVEHDAFLDAKERVRPVKHFVVGKSDIFYVLDVIRRARSDVAAAGVVLDVGAAVGDRTRLLLDAFPQATVYCFEPQAAARERLTARTSRWGDRVRILPVGLYDESTTSVLHLASYRDASSLLPLPHFVREQGKTEVGLETIELRRLDDVAADLGISHIDFMKIDVEGVERRVLAGAANTLQLTDNIYVEMSPLRYEPHSSEHLEVFRMLYESGFTYLGPYGDHWFSKDHAVLATYFGPPAA